MKMNTEETEAYDGTADTDTDSQLHLVLHCHPDGGDVFRCVSLDNEPSG